MRTFDLSYFKSEVDKMDEQTYNRLKNVNQPKGSQFRFLYNPLCDFAHDIGFDVLVKDPQRASGYCASSLHSKTLGLCRRPNPYDDGPFEDVRGKIYLHPETDHNERVRVLCHEITHALGAFMNDRGTDEVTAETTAYTVCREFGLDTWNFSLQYVAYYRHCEDALFSKATIDNYANQILGSIK